MAKQLLINGLQLLPSSFFQRLIQVNYNHKLLKNIARLGVKNRQVTIENGLGSGLKFDCGLSNPDAALGIYEIPVQETLAKNLKPGDICYDIGANVGFFTIFVAKLVGKTGKVYAFEPAPDNANLLRKNIQLNNFDYVTVIEKAVSQTSQPGKLLLNNYCGGHILINPESETEKTISVDVVSIDDLLETQTISPPNLVKIDVEGVEIDVFKGMLKTISKYRPILLYEIDDKNKQIFLEKQKNLNDFVRNLGYQVTLIEAAYPDINWNVGHGIAHPI